MINIILIGMYHVIQLTYFLLLHGRKCDFILNIYNSCTKIPEVNLSAFIYRLFHEDFSSIIGPNPVDYSQPSIYALYIAI